MVEPAEQDVEAASGNRDRFAPWGEAMLYETAGGGEGKLGPGSGPGHGVITPNRAVRIRMYSDRHGRANTRETSVQVLVLSTKRSGRSAAW